MPSTSRRHVTLLHGSQENLGQWRTPQTNDSLFCVTHSDGSDEADEAEHHVQAQEETNTSRAVIKIPALDIKRKHILQP